MKHPVLALLFLILFAFLPITTTAQVQDSIYRAEDLVGQDYDPSLKGRIKYMSRQEESPAIGTTWLHAKPLVYTLGANFGFETAINQNMAVGADIVAHFWFSDPSICLNPQFRWFFTGSTQRGFYLQVRGTFGFQSGGGYGGAGVMAGYKSPFSVDSRWGFFAEAGVRYVFNGFPNYHSFVISDAHIFHYYFIAPSSPFVLSFGITYRI